MERDALIFVAGAMAGLFVAWVARALQERAQFKIFENISKNIRLQLPPEDDGEWWKRGESDGSAN